MSYNTHCKDCQEELTIFNTFWQNGSRRGICKECQSKRMKKWNDANKERKKILNRNYKLKNDFNLTTEQFDELLQKQGGVCAVCKNPNNVEGRELSVDHCHSTGTIRGLLCQKCNVALGLLNEDESIIFNLLEYLQEYRDKHDHATA